MIKKYYIVTFTNELTVFTVAFNEKEANILAQAVMIKKGYTYDVENTRETRYMSDIKLANFCA